MIQICTVERHPAHGDIVSVVDTIDKPATYENLWDAQEEAWACEGRARQAPGGLAGYYFVRVPGKGRWLSGGWQSDLTPTTEVGA